MNQAAFDFADATVLVTGGTSGIGHAIATAFATAGATVTITGTRSGPELYDTDLSPFSYRQAEMTEPESIDALVGTLEELDVLVNNAGANFPGGRDEWEPDTFAAALALNLVGPMRLTIGCRAPVGSQCARRRRERGEHGVAGRIPVDPHRSRLWVGEGWTGDPDAQSGPFVGKRRHPGERRGPGRHQHTDDGSDDALPRAARSRVGAHTDGPAG